MIVSDDEKKRIQRLHLREFAGPEDYVVKIGVPAIDEAHANQIIQECLYNGCPEKADQFSLFTSNLRF